MIISMPPTAHPQQRYDHQLRELVQRAEDVIVGTDHGAPRSTARGWLGFLIGTGTRNGTNSARLA
jgi:hypothetical protein